MHPAAIPAARLMIFCLGVPYLCLLALLAVTVPISFATVGLYVVAATGTQIPFVVLPSSGLLFLVGFAGLVATPLLSGICHHLRQAIDTVNTHMYCQVEDDTPSYQHFRAA